MEFLFFADIKQLTGYTDNRSIKAFLNELRVPVLRIGRRAAVDKALFESRVEKKYQFGKTRNTYRPTQETEKEFLNEVDHLLSENGAR